MVTFDSPPLNLFDAPLARRLVAAVGELETEPPAGGPVPRRGTGGQRRGGRLAVRGPVGAAEAARAVFDELVALARRVDALPCPTVFAAHALCLTWAFELALACDLILAAESASFGLVERVIGLTPAMGGTQRLAERAGSGRAREFVMAGRPLQRAPSSSAGTSSTACCPTTASTPPRVRLPGSSPPGPTLAHAATKQVIRDYLEGGVELANERVGKVAGELFATEDLQNAVRSFLEQGPGKATFHGR